MSRRITNGDEADAHSRWRHILTCFQRAGVAKATKRRTNRRERREGQDEVIEQYYEMDDYDTE